MKIPEQGTKPSLRFSGSGGEGGFLLTLCFHFIFYVHICTVAFKPMAKESKLFSSELQIEGLGPTTQRVAGRQKNHKLFLDMELLSQESVLLTCCCFCPGVGFHIFSYNILLIQTFRDEERRVLTNKISLFLYQSSMEDVSSYCSVGSDCLLAHQT